MQEQWLFTNWKPTTAIYSENPPSHPDLNLIFDRRKDPFQFFTNKENYDPFSSEFASSPPSRLKRNLKHFSSLPLSNKKKILLLFEFILGFFQRLTNYHIYTELQHQHPLSTKLRFKVHSVYSDCSIALCYLICVFIYSLSYRIFRFLIITLLFYRFPK